MGKSKDVQLWLRRAKSSLVHSKDTKSDDLFYEDLCFDCQQSAEKALKGLIIDLGLTPHKTHAMGKLLEELSKRISLPEWSEDLLELNDYAVQTRYPDDFREVTEEEYRRAVEIAERVYNWVVENIE